MTVAPSIEVKQSRPGLGPGRAGFLLIVASAVLIAYEFLIVRLFSYLYWGDFGYFSIAVAMFGFSLSGVLIAYLRSRDFSFSLPFLATVTILTSLALFLAPIILSLIPFQPILIFHSAAEFVHLLEFGFLLAVPFLAGYCLIGILLTEKIEKIGFYYGLNLGGAALGGLLFTFILTRFPFPVQFKILSLLFLLPLFFMGGRGIKLIPAAVAAALIMIPFPEPVPSDFKDIARAENVPEFSRVERRETPYGIITVLSSPYFRTVPGLSLNYSGELKGEYLYFQNGDTRGRLPLISDLSRLTYLEYLPSALPYLLRDFDRHLYLSSRGGEAWLKAFYFGEGEAVVTLADPYLRQTVQHLIRSKDFYGIEPERIHLLEAGARQTVERTRKSYDLIEIDRLGGVGYRGGTRSDYLLTRQGLRACLEALSERGIFSLTFSIQNPPRNVPRMLLLLKAVGDELGWDISKGLLVHRGWNTASFLYLKGGVSGEVLETARDFWERCSFDPIYFPGIVPGDANRYNRFPEPSFYRAARQILKGDRYRSENFDLSLPGDSRPFFNYFIPFFSAFSLFRKNRDLALKIISFDEMMLFLNLGVSLALGLLFLIFPVAGILRGKRKDIPISGALYFLAIGFGFLFVELLLIQKLSRFTGNYLVSLITVLTGMLVAAGAGSWLLFPRLEGKKKFAAATAVFIFVIYLPLYLLLDFTPLYHSQPILYLALVGGLGLTAAGVMGIYFPAGMKMVRQRDRLAPAWMWAFNGLASVVAPAAATLISIRAGFPAVFAISIVLYLLALAIFLVWKK